MSTQSPAIPQAEPATQQDPEAAKWEKGSDFLKDRFPGNGFLRLTHPDDLNRPFYIKICEIVTIQRYSQQYTKIVMKAGAYCFVCESPIDIFRLIELFWIDAADAEDAEDQNSNPAQSPIAEALTNLAGGQDALSGVLAAIAAFESSDSLADGVLEFASRMHDHVSGVVEGCDRLGATAAEEIAKSREFLGKFAAGLESIKVGRVASTVWALDKGLRNLAQRLLVPDAQTVPLVDLLNQCAKHLDQLAEVAAFGARIRAGLLLPREWLDLMPPEVAKLDPRWAEALATEDVAMRAWALSNLKRAIVQPEATPQPVQPEVAGPHEDPVFKGFA